MSCEFRCKYGKMKLPKLSCHKSCGLGYATWHGKEIYFGCCPRAKRRQSPSGKPMGLSSRSRSAERSPTPKRWPKLRSANAAQFFFIGPNRNLEQRSARATVPSPCPSLVCLAKRRPATLDRSSCAEFSSGLSSPPHRVQAEGRGENPFWTDSKDQEWNHFSINRIRRTRRFGSHQAV